MTEGRCSAPFCPGDELKGRGLAQQVLQDSAPRQEVGAWCPYGTTQVVIYQNVFPALERTFQTAEVVAQEDS